MSGKSELINALLGILIGNAVAKEQLSKDIRERISHLKHFKIRSPIQAMNQCGILCNFYREAVMGYLLGLPNSSIAMSVKVLELALKWKYKSNESLEQLINKVIKDSSLKTSRMVLE